jgi:CubicO group peptidase (beta-lactamase class C family)
LKDIGKGLTRRAAIGGGLGGIALGALPSFASAAPTGTQDRKRSQIDATVRSFMRAFEIPGVAVGVVGTGQGPFSRTYGHRLLGNPAPVDASTLFSIASNTKAFLTAALAMLVDEGKLGWDDPVRQHMPDFRMHDADVTRMMTVRDLLVHRSGLPLGAGDLMLVAASTHKREDFLRALPHLELERGFRTGYHYDNILYVVAGILLERVTGEGWEDFLTSRIFAPLGMRNALPNIEMVRASNRAGRHARIGPPVRGLGDLAIVEPGETAAPAPAGGIQVSISEILPWLELQLGRGALTDGRRLWSEEQAEQLWNPQILTFSTRGPTAELPYRPVLAAYALGWHVTDYRGRRLVGHSGVLVGQNTRIDLLPEQGLGIAVFTNIEDTTVHNGLRYALLDHFLGVPEFDWVAATQRLVRERDERALQRMEGGDLARPPGGPNHPLHIYAGRYRDPWYGEIVVTQRGQELHIDFLPTPTFKSALEPWGEDTFRTRFPPGAGEDAVVIFRVENNIVKAVEMKALSPLADFSFDFHHLAFSPVR